MNNTIFGKTMENVCNHIDFWHVGAEDFHSRSVFSENLVTIEMRKLEMKFDKPIYVSMYICCHVV